MSLAKKIIIFISTLLIIYFLFMGVASVITILLIKNIYVEKSQYLLGSNAQQHLNYLNLWLENFISTYFFWSKSIPKGFIWSEIVSYLTSLIPVALFSLNIKLSQTKIKDYICLNPPSQGSINKILPVFFLFIIFSTIVSCVEPALSLAKQLSLSPSNPYLFIRSALFYPLLEETLFRGYLLTFISKIIDFGSLGKWAFIISSVFVSLLFASFHTQYQHWLILFEVFFSALHFAM